MQTQNEKIKILNEINKNIEKCINKDKKDVINNIIQYEKWYVNMEINTFVSILKDIGYSKDKAIEYYKKIVLDL